MRTLNFTVKGQTLAADGDFTGLARGSENYLECRFDFDETWDETEKVAVFGHEAVSIEDDACTPPSEALKDRIFTIRLIGKDGDKTITTNQIAIRQGG